MRAEGYQPNSASDQKQPANGETREAADPGPAAPCRKRDGASATGTDTYALQHRKEGNLSRPLGAQLNL